MKTVTPLNSFDDDYVKVLQQEVAEKDKLIEHLKDKLAEEYAKQERPHRE